jgi:SAM-dependent methyltransferase
LDHALNLPFSPLRPLLLFGRAVVERSFEHRLNITSLVTAEDSVDRRFPHAKYGDSGDYLPPDYLNLNRVVRMLKIGPEDVFYDIGCGKGRVLCVVARRPIQRVVGIEISESLCEKARENVDRLRGGLCSIEVVCADACDASLIDGTIYFLYNPFGVDTLRHVIDRIHSTLANNPRNIKVVYYNALHSDVLLNAGWLGKYASFLTKTGREVSFWRNRKARD